jgi:hypothetical protein
MIMKSKSLVAAAALTVAASGAFAQGQEGLVNLSVDDNTVQVPVDVAANVCDLDVNVLSSDFAGTDKTACEIDQETAAQNGIDTGNNGNGNGNGNGNNDNASNDGNNGQQNGLVNLSLDGNTVQAPIGVAANVCDVDANVIARDFQGTGESVCSITQEQAAENGIATSGTGDSDMNDVSEDAAEAAEDAAEDIEETREDAAEEAEDIAEDAAEEAEENTEAATNN